jgi:branched-chain amino acid transport system ATP-binding protein
MLDIANLQAGYGATQILFDVSFSAKPSEIICLLGRNGAGKTTTLKTIMGLLSARAGEIRLDGKRLNRLAPHQVARSGAGYVPEDRAIFPNLTVAENLAMGDWRGRPSAKATETVLGFFPRLRDKLTTRGAVLSGGEQQMLSIGRALMAAPKLLLVDEPAEGLAPVIVQALEETFSQLAAAGLCIVIAESKLATARRIATRIHVMGKGRCVFAGTAAALQDRHDIRREFLEV